MIRSKPFFFLAFLFLIQISSITTILGQQWKPDLVLLGIIVLSLKSGPREVLIESATWGLFLDLYTGRFLGLHTLLAIGIPLAIHATSKIVSAAQPFLAFVFTIILHSFYYGSLYLSSLFFQGSNASLNSFLAHLFIPTLFINLIAVLFLFIFYTETRQFLTKDEYAS